MTQQTLYSLRTDGDQYRITKIVDGEIESSYLSTERECECPAGHRPSCRHRQMLPEMLARGLCNTHWFWNFDTHRVVDFNGELKSNIDALNELAVGRDRTATEIDNTPSPELKEPLLEYLVDRTLAVVDEAQHVEAPLPQMVAQRREQLRNEAVGAAQHTEVEPITSTWTDLQTGEVTKITYVDLPRSSWRRL